MVSMNRLSTADRARVVASLVEGNSIRATVRMTGVAKNTIVKLLVELGDASSKFHKVMQLCPRHRLAQHLGHREIRPVSCRSHEALLSLRFARHQSRFEIFSTSSMNFETLLHSNRFSACNAFNTSIAFFVLSVHT